MSVANLSGGSRRMAVPFILLMLALLALVLSLIGVHRTSEVATERLDQLQTSWQLILDGEVQGSELVAMDNAMQSISNPVPAIRSSSVWSLITVFLSLGLLAWLVFTVRHELRAALERGAGVERSEQASLLKLTDEIAPLASGDLRVRATVSDSLAGGLADAFNYSVSEMRWMVSTMGSSAEMVSRSVDNSKRSTEEINAAFLEQSEHIHRSSNLLLALSGTMAELSASASDTSGMAQAALKKADAGATALSTSLNTLSTVCAEADRTTEKMMRLSENARGIDDRISAIEEVAKRTDLLALNTTIRASTSTSSPHGSGGNADLGQLSDEVGQLVDLLGDAIKDIGTITRTISTDAADTAKSMGSISQDIETSLQQTSEANQFLNEIREDSSDLSAHARGLAEATMEHAATVSKLTENMDLINQIAQQTTRGIDANEAFLEEMHQLACELRQGSADYNLPEKSNTSSSTRESASVARQAADRAVIHG